MLFNDSVGESSSEIKEYSPPCPDVPQRTDLQPVGESSSEVKEYSPSHPDVPKRTHLEPVKIRAGLAAELLELLRIK